jgi:hypothetical protein
MSVEKIARAAVKYGDEVWSVEIPGRHHTIMHMYVRMRGRMDLTVEERAEQGFLTTTGRFVGRFEAARIAVESGQIEKPNWPPRLYSEDLW